MTGNQSFLSLINDLPGPEQILWLSDSKSPSSYDMMEVKLCDPIKSFIFQKKGPFSWNYNTEVELSFAVTELWSYVFVYWYKKFDIRISVVIFSYFLSQI